MRKQLVVVIMLVSSGGAISQDDISKQEIYPKMLAEKYQVSASRLFENIPDNLDRKPIEQTKRESDYSYLTRFNSSTHNQLFTKIKSIYELNKLKGKSYKFGMREPESNSTDSLTVTSDVFGTINLGVDLNFDVGNILSSDTIISEIKKTNMIVDGKEMASYSVRYRNTSLEGFPVHGELNFLNESLTGWHRGSRFDIEFHNNHLGQLVVTTSDKQRKHTNKKMANDTIPDTDRTGLSADDISKKKNQMN